MTLSIDIETFSSEDLVKSGVYRYAEAPDFRVLLFGYSVNGGPGRRCLRGFYRHFRMKRF